MPRSSRGSTSHRGHRTRGRHNEQPQAAVATPPEATATDADDKATDSATSSQMQEPTPRVATPTPQPVATTVSGTTMRGDPLLTKELIRIAILAALVLALLITFTTLLR